MIILFHPLFLDNENPAIHSCPSNQLQEVNENACTATLMYSKPTATDNSGEATVTCNPISGSSLKIGTTSIRCQARDLSHNQAVCSFQVSVPVPGKGMITITIRWDTYDAKHLYVHCTAHSPKTMDVHFPVFSLRGYCTSYIHISMFCALSQNYQLLLSNI